MRRAPLRRFIALSLVLILSLCVIAPAFAKYSTIPYGEKSDAVRAMQKALKDQGYYKGSVDGSFGPATQKAVKKFQSSAGLKADGKPGNRTLSALYDGASANEVIARKAREIIPKNPNSLYYGCAGDRVKTLQRALKAAGYYSGSIDGTFGESTESAVKKFQSAKQMHVDGIAGTKTIAALNKAQKKVKIGSSFTLTLGSRGSTVKTVQAKLYTLGYWSTIDDPSGFYQDGTTEMVKDWQRDNGHSATGALTEKQYNQMILGK